MLGRDPPTVSGRDQGRVWAPPRIHSRGYRSSGWPGTTGRPDGRSWRSRSTRPGPWPGAVDRGWPGPSDGCWRCSDAQDRWCWCRCPQARRRSVPGDSTTDERWPGTRPGQRVISGWRCCDDRGAPLIRPVPDGPNAVRTSGARCGLRQPVHARSCSLMTSAPRDRPCSRRAVAWVVPVTGCLVRSWCAIRRCTRLGTLAYPDELSGPVMGRWGAEACIRRWCDEVVEAGGRRPSGGLSVWADDSIGAGRYGWNMVGTRPNPVPTGPVRGMDARDRGGLGWTSSSVVGTSPSATRSATR